MLLMMLSCSQSLPEELQGAWVQVMAAEHDRDMRTLIFTKGTDFKGQTGCGSIEGTISIEGYTVKVKDLVSKRRKCKSKRKEYEQIYIERLAAIESWNKKQNILYLDGQKGSLSYRKESDSDRH